MLKAGNRFDDSAFIGLGAGTLAAYSTFDTHMTFFEIDPAVVEIATDPKLFTYITDARRDYHADIDLVVADGRLGIASTTRGPFRLIVVDAFSSDAIPVHLLTREAIDVYTRALDDHGVLFIHISNQNLDLHPVVAALRRLIISFRRRGPIVAEHRSWGTESWKTSRVSGPACAAACP